MDFVLFFLFSCKLCLFMNREHHDGWALNPLLCSRLLFAHCSAKLCTVFLVTLYPFSWYWCTMSATCFSRTGQCAERPLDAHLVPGMLFSLSSCALQSRTIFSVMPYRLAANLLLFCSLAKVTTFNLKLASYFFLETEIPWRSLRFERLLLGIKCSLLHQHNYALWDWNDFVSVSEVLKLLTHIWFRKYSSV